MAADKNNLSWKGRILKSTTSSKYGTSFGFTEDAVFAAMDEFGFAEKEEVKN